MYQISCLYHKMHDVSLSIRTIVILSPSAKGLQKLLNICSEYGEEHDIMSNHKKTGMYVFSSQMS